ncbi:MAG: membrane-bound lytic murein transglycosylase MltF [Bdellovibrionota bacterium]|nr:membrane-bound lytic murein transglycosylase MltF [Pseudobdellovibrionaceae bacterium]|tara:strand:+ start:44746 stop:46107 length:1362 start_codon:yes stop_codon:yes gene_type:complete
MKASVLLFLLAFNVSCDFNKLFTSFSPDSQLVAVTKNSPTTYYFDRYDDKSGFEYELLKAFAEASGRKLKLLTASNISEMKSLLDKNKVDVIASGISVTEERMRANWQFGPVYAQTKELLICRKGVRIQAKKESSFLGKKLFVVNNSTYVSSLQEAGFDLEYWQKQDTNTEDLLDRVENQEIDCTVSDEHIYQLQRKFTENLINLGPIQKSQSLAWVIDPKNKKLKEQLDKWMFDFLESGKLEDVYEKYYGYSNYKFNHFDIQTFNERILERLPKYKDIFVKAAKKYNFPWELIAAVSYQESHWDERAVSPTGVRGLMMLTRKTARLMKVNRLVPEQSVDGGVRYLLSLHKTLPKSIKEPDRTWVSLAAYNVGLGHIFDVRRLIRQSRGEPNSWKEIKFYLPYLSKEKVYRNLKYGYARGYEPVKYVRRIRTYYEILKNLDNKKTDLDEDSVN